jgi:hypothetical protein
VNIRRFWPVGLPLLLLAFAGFRSQRAADRPALVVMISVDQLRADLIPRYAQFYQGGFRRLIEQGAYFTSVHDHSGSETGPGHATLSTGVYPAHSGIVANNWQEEVGGKWVSVYNVSDSLSPIVGFPNEDGMSPRNLLHTGVADWIAATPGAKVASISGKDRSAILMAGKARGDVYWFSAEQGQFITSSYYASAYPAWVQNFHAKVLPTLADSVWEESSPLAARALARPDTALYEADGVDIAFPHRFVDVAKGADANFWSWAETTPLIDRVVLKMVETAIPALGLGKDGVTDFIAVGLAQTDKIGHRYGPQSREQLDNLLRLDEELGDFFTYLDRTVGKGRWTAVLSADHGSTTMVEWRVTHGQPGYRINSADRAYIAEIARIAAESAPAGREQETVAAALRNLPLIADAYTFNELTRGEPRDSFVTLFRHSFSPTRATSSLRKYGVDVRYTEGSYGAAKGTGHGSAYVYDRAVPLIFLGAGVRPGLRLEPARTVDLAPTLAHLAGAAAPGDLDGRVLPAGE